MKIPEQAGQFVDINVRWTLMNCPKNSVLIDRHIGHTYPLEWVQWTADKIRVCAYGATIYWFTYREFKLSYKIKLGVADVPTI